MPLLGCFRFLKGTGGDGRGPETRSEVLVRADSPRKGHRDIDHRCPVYVYMSVALSRLGRNTSLNHELPADLLNIIRGSSQH